MVWWSDPAKEVLNIVFNRLLAPYVENLDMGQVSYGIGQGRVTLRNLRLKKGALDKFRLPVDVIEGHLGKFTLSLHWMNLGNQPVEVLVEDVYLLVVPSAESTYDPEEEEKRKQAAKMERLENAELLHVRGQSDPQGLIESLITKIVNNLQVSVKNIHMRYEDKMSVPGHPFATGLTLAGFTAVSVNELWEPAFIDSKAGAIHKLAKLESLALYFDTDAGSMAGLSHADFIQRFTEQGSISQGDYMPNHQFILKPVTGEGRIMMNHELTKDTPRFDVQLFFNEIGVLLDDNQYRDAISLVDMYHFYMRQHQYQRYRPSTEEFEQNRPRALIRFAGRAILDEVHERRRRWAWAYFAERRDDRHRYLELFKKKQLNPLSDPEAAELTSLEEKLSYEDLRFYRSIARSQLRKDMASRKKVEEENKQKQEVQARTSWSSWLWGSSSSSDTTESKLEDSMFTGEMTDEQRRELYEVLDYDEKAAIAESLEVPRDALKTRVVAQLDRGSFALKMDPHGRDAEITSIVSDVFQVTFIERPDNFETSVSLGGFAVYDGTTKSTLYKQIVHVQERQGGGDVVKTQAIREGEKITEMVDPFFYLKFEQNPLDERADSALQVKMRYMEIVYHRGYVEAIYKFFKPPSSQLESVEALLDVASQTLEGLRKETRAGLEYALQTHKTLDVHMDLNAPIIIIPEDITTHECKHLVIDAGHIAIESQLGNKDAIKEIQAKRKQEYTEEDYKRLESMMYDRLSVRLKDTQFLVGNDLQSCMDALTSEGHDNLHLLERITLDLQVQNSIVPTAYNLSRFKISGHLPSLQVNLSDTKYKSLMRLIDVTVPNFDGDEDKAVARPTLGPHVSGAFRLPSGLFDSGKAEYSVDDGQSETASVASDDHEDEEEEFFDAGETITSQASALHQHLVEFNFQVDVLRASLYKSTVDGGERAMGDVAFERFALAFSMAKYVMTVDINLSSVSMNVFQPGKEPMECISSAGESNNEDLLIVKYNRVQPLSPEYQSRYQGIDQNVDVKFTTFIFRAAPEPVLSLYEFIMTTFVPDRTNTTPKPSPDVAAADTAILIGQKAANDSVSDKIKVVLKLAGIQVILINNDIRLATLSLSTADVSIFLRANTMHIGGRLGSLDLCDDSPIETSLPAFKQILSIEGDNFAEFQYQTFDPADKINSKGAMSAVSLKAGSLKMHYLEQSLHDIYLFVTKLAKLKGLYDAAAEAAAQRASEIERMQFDVSIKTPIVIFPSDARQSQDVLTLRLGEFKASNRYEGVAAHTAATLHGIQLASTIYYQGNESFALKLVDDIDIDANVIQISGIDRSKSIDQPDTQAYISDVRLHLTQTQYSLLIMLSESIPRVLAGAPEGDAQATEVSAVSPQTSSAQIASPSTPMVDLQPELRPKEMPGNLRSWTSLDLVVTVDAVKLHLYDDSAIMESSLKEHGIVRFALNHNSLRMKLLADGAIEVQLIFKSLTMNNTRPGNSKFREIIPAAKHERNQVMLLYTKSHTDDSALAVVTIDSPKVIFAVDPVIALLSFFTSPFSADLTPQSDIASNRSDGTGRNDTPSSQIGFRLDLHDVSISVLQDDSDPESQAIRLSVKQILLSQQGILALSVDHLGMSLTRMGRETSESVRFLDDVDLTLSMDSRSNSSHQMTSIQISVKPIIFRSSYRDIDLIMTIVNRALELYAQSAASSQQISPSREHSQSTPAKRPSLGTSPRKASRTGSSHVKAIGQSHVSFLTQFNGSFDGLRLVLIGDLHEQPLLHIKVKPFILGAKDWSGELHATSTLGIHISYWNISNSHWEPLIDPWTFTVSITKTSVPDGMESSISSRDRLDINVTTTFVELAISTMKMLGQEGASVLRKARGSYAPYRIFNRTGSSIFVWSDVDGSTHVKETTSKQITSGKMADWRFDDWKTMREHVTSSGHNSIGLQFIGKPWEPLRSIPLDREGEFTFSLRPRTDKYAHRLLVEVRVQGNVKVVTLRSIYRVVNDTLYPLELTLVDEAGQPVHSVEKIAPGQDYALPIEAVNRDRIRVQPDRGFGYKWSHAVRWEDLVAKRDLTLKCPHTEPNESAFRFQVWVETNATELTTRKIPKITVRLRAPIELENLLPYNIEYRIYDKDTDQNWRSYLRMGGVMPVHSVELGHLILLNILVQETPFKQSDFAIINTDGSSDFDIEHRLVLRDARDRKLELRLNYVRHVDGGSSFKVQIYCPYLVINKTSLPFAVRPGMSNRIASSQEMAGETRREILAKPIPFMLSHPNDQGKDFAFRIGDSVWSSVVTLDAPAADTRLAVPSQVQRSEEIHIGLSWSEGLGKYKLTKVITLAPRFIIKNNFSRAIAFREHGVAPRGRSTLDPGERCSLQFIRTGEEKLLTIALPGLNAQWSAPINMEDIGSVHFRLYGTGESGVAQLMRADVKIEGSTIFIFIFEATEGWPFTIENDSDFTFTFYQSDQTRSNIDAPPTSVSRYNLPKQSRVDYAWDYPAARDKRIVLAVNDFRRAVDVMEIGDLVPFRFSERQSVRAVSLDVRADGHKQILRITNYNPEQSLYRPKRSTSVSLNRQDTVSGSQDAFEAVQADTHPSLIVTVDMEGVGISLINRRMTEVAYLSANALKFEYTDSAMSQAVNLSCGILQIDSQLHDALFPVVLQPTPISQESIGVASLPTVQGSVIWLKDQAHGVFFVKYCSILLQALTIEADEGFLWAVLDLTKIKGASWDEGQQDVLIQHPEEIPEPHEFSDGQDLYFEVLELQPIRLSISFMLTGKVSNEDTLSLRNPLAVVVNAIVMTVGNVNDAALEMNALAIKDMRLTLPDLQGRIMHHYQQEILRQLYRILGSADFIGNPVGLFNNVSSGVADIFYEPFNGAVMHGNSELGVGIAKGAASFVKKTVFGFSDSMTKFTSSVGKGLSATTFDPEFQLRRRMNQRRNRPRHAIYGVTAGADAFATSIASGIEGMVTKPLEGAESEGAKGFFKGVGKGLIGAVTKPVVGAFDLVANLSEGIRNTTTVFDVPARDRVRLPRLTPADGVLVPYSNREALGQFWMKDLNEGAYRDELYVAHINLPGGDNVVLLTASRALSFWSNKLRLDWDLPLTLVQGVTIEDTGIRFAHKSGKDHDKFVCIPDKNTQTWFFGQVAAVVKVFNARRRMDS
ncbi:vacuolar protein sorting-associated protein 13 [Laetiporus sulphureus 93-53]|uniref:Vacuolar protein sorting-associated protein 13 n=1 Tax=Laetiporus sulphureus 93-53 TaxID=1314785 RepID=A0A165CF99_9APHY|nr:vacuolar protein sorting-associated protein 13 [Laetiporus sulphureus 93-53]KZT02705.1 vacuolar protein sorting-associated protein 13 [Laetiporus sulphureus 93-53]